jgi:putative transferase (TIGR04331 family)
MPKIARHLVTSADERTWQPHGPTLFLGEWCKLNARKNYWGQLDQITAKPYGIGKSTKDSDYKQCRLYEKKIFNALVISLNQTHNTTHSNRFWDILLGHWLRYFIDITYNRVKTLEQCFANYSITSYTTYHRDKLPHIPADFSEAMREFQDPTWNEYIYSQIIEILNPSNMEIIHISDDSYNQAEIIHHKNSFLKSLAKRTYQYLAKLSGVFESSSDALIINSYLSQKEELKLRCLLGQSPIKPLSNSYKSSAPPNYVLRDSLAEQLTFDQNSLVEKTMGKLLFELLPTIYLEGFKGLNTYCQQLKWPKNPKFIYTCNNFAFDEAFKLWAAQKTELGIPYIAGQHGNNYGTYRYMNPSVEERTTDYFVTWGWNQNASNLPGFIFKFNSENPQTYQADGGLLLIELHSSMMVSTWDETAEFSQYFSDQQSFVKQLNSKPKQELTIRLHHDHIHLNWDEVARWNEFDPSLKLDMGNSRLSSLISESRLVVHSYDSTGILETLSQNIPTIAFWQNNLDHLRENVIDDYQALVDAGIIHLSPDSAAKHINQIWEDISTWWQNPRVQEARAQFCDKYANLSAKPANDLKNILCQASNKVLQSSKASINSSV